MFIFMKNKKSFNWYGLRQRFSIRKYHFGAASVLLGSVFVLSGGVAQANEQFISDKPSALVNRSTVESAPKTHTEKEKLMKKEGIPNPVAAPKEESLSDKSSAVKSEIPEKKEAAKEVEKAKEDLEKAKEDLEKAKEDLEKAVNEAKALNTSALSYAEKSVKDEKAKDALIQAIENAKKAIEKANELEKSKTVTAEELNKQRSAVNNALEAVYTAMKVAGHDEKVSAVLADVTTNKVYINNPVNKVAVKSFKSLTDEEVQAVEREIRAANPSLTAEDRIEVPKSGALDNMGAILVLSGGKVDQFGNVAHRFEISDVMQGSTSSKNFAQLRETINWFDFTTSTITYADGTKVGAVEYVDNAPTVAFTSSKGRQEQGRFTMIRTVLESTAHPELVGKKTNDPAFLASGLAKYTLWKTYNDVNAEVTHGGVIWSF